VRIGELARATGTSPRALRFYEERGLLTSGRAGNGYRSYDPAAVTRVANIRYLLDAGLTLDDVVHFRACLDGDVAAAPPSEPLLQVARRRLRVLDERLATLAGARDRLAAQLERTGTRPA
jgi:DNA-binding transcriptional MerR regulator